MLLVVEVGWDSMYSRRRKSPLDSPGGRYDGGKEEEIALVVVVLVVVELRFKVQ
jgi:hypothetical protein